MRWDVPLGTLTKESKESSSIFGRHLRIELPNPPSVGSRNRMWVVEYGNYNYNCTIGRPGCGELIDVIQVGERVQITYPPMRI